MAKDIAAFFRWLFFAAGPLEQAIVNTSFGWAARHATRRRSHRLWQPCRSRTHALTRHLETNDYIADGRFTAADVYVGAQVGWGLRLQDHPGQ